MLSYVFAPADFNQPTHSVTNQELAALFGIVYAIFKRLPLETRCSLTQAEPKQTAISFARAKWTPRFLRAPAVEIVCCHLTVVQ